MINDSRRAIEPTIIDNRRIIGHTVDPDTGEVRMEIREGDRIIPKHIYEQIIQKSNDPNDLAYYYVNFTDYVKLNKKCVKLISTIGLTKKDYEVMFCMIEHLQYNSNMAIHKNGHSLTKAHIAEELDTSERIIAESLNSLQKKGIISFDITKGKVKLFFNPHIYMQGRYANRTLAAMFRGTDFAKISGIDL